jgi:hypothetical protein
VTPPVTIAVLPASSGMTKPFNFGGTYGTSLLRLHDVRHIC